MSTPALTGDQIREAARATQIDRQPLVIPELGGTIYVRGMSGKERDRFDEGLRGRKGKLDTRNFRAQLAVRVIVDESGQRLLNDGDVDLIGGLHAGVLDRIVAKCRLLSGDAEEEIVEMGNDSASKAVSDGSASSSPAN